MVWPGVTLPDAPERRIPARFLMLESPATDNGSSLEIWGALYSGQWGVLLLQTFAVCAPTGLQRSLSFQGLGWSSPPQPICPEFSALKPFQISSS